MFMVYILIGIFVLSVILNGVLGYSTWNLLKKNEIAEDFVVDAYLNARGTLMAMRELDNKEMFETDDEVGAIFKQLVSLVEEYAGFVGVEEAMENET